jgi:hypothetical protein
MEAVRLWQVERCVPIIISSLLIVFPTGSGMHRIRKDVSIYWPRTAVTQRLRSLRCHLICLVIPFRGDAGVWIQDSIAEPMDLIAVLNPYLSIFRLRLLVSSPFSRHRVRSMDCSEGVADVLSGGANVGRVIGVSHQIRGAESNNLCTAVYDRTTDPSAPLIKKLSMNRSVGRYNYLAHCLNLFSS